MSNLLLKVDTQAPVKTAPEAADLAARSVDLTPTSPFAILSAPSGPNQLVTLSTGGWHDTNGLPGAESTLTTGNNVDAYTDINNNNNGTAPDTRANGGVNLLFDFPLNFADNPIGSAPRR